MKKTIQELTTYLFLTLMLSIIIYFGVEVGNYFSSQIVGVLIGGFTLSTIIQLIGTLEQEEK